MAAALIGLAIIVLLAGAVVGRERLHRTHWYFKVERFVTRYPVTVALLFLTAAGLYGFGLLNAADRRACHRAQTGFAVLRTIVKRADTAIDSIAYYKTHPTEAAKAHRDNARALRDLRPPHCP
jgi:hypothetical protein